jgi:PPOX class probable FMN-dependent enzyme
MDFTQVITDVDSLRSIIAEPKPKAAAKDTQVLDSHCRDFIARSPFVLIASDDGRGNFDISPKGDPAGFVKVLNDTTLAIPDRLGNGRVDSFLNILEHPYVGLIFMIPGVRNTLRVSGRARIVADEDLLASMEMNGTPPRLALVVDEITGFFHCAKCIVRSELWSSRAPQDNDDRILARAMVAHGELDVTVEEMQDIILNDEQTRLY